VRTSSVLKRHSILLLAASLLPDSHFRLEGLEVRHSPVKAVSVEYAKSDFGSSAAQIEAAMSSAAKVESARVAG
jgi:hypothetical protein